MRLICLTLAAFALAASLNGGVAKDQGELSIYFGIQPDVQTRDEGRIEANAFGIVELEAHVLNSSALPEASFRDPERAAPYFPDGYTIKESFFDQNSQPVEALTEPGPYRIELTVATPDRDYTWERILYRLPDSAPRLGDRSETAAAKLIAADALGRPWQPGDAFPYSFALQWLWDTHRASGQQDPLQWFAKNNTSHETNPEQP